jgi:ATP-dependent RNA helicase HelY
VSTDLAWRESEPERDVRDDFLRRLAFVPDEFQLRAFDALDDGHSVVVAAPTGSGKTIVAEYALARALARGRRAVYTTPLKALSNQKLVDLGERFGTERIGLMTGDRVVRPDAPVVVMTTEVLRNIIYEEQGRLHDVDAVILDEVHYLQNPYRGAVWEEVIIHAPPWISFVCLSATISNVEELSSWVATLRGETDTIVEGRRPVPLELRYLVGDRHHHDCVAVPILEDGRPSREGRRFDLDGHGRRPHGSRGRGAGTNPLRQRWRSPRRVEVVEWLEAEGLLPAIAFIFSRKGCDDAVRLVSASGITLTSASERAEIRRRAEAHTEGLADDELSVLGYGEWLDALEAGVAAHHAGLVPPLKEAVEDCFAAGLVKLVFATETLSLGINMPARTVVLERLRKFSGERHEDLTPAEFTQLVGRAGRRGLDQLGHGIVCWSPERSFADVASLAGSKAFTLESSFRPTYNMAANLVRRYRRAEAEAILKRSFAQFQFERRLATLLGSRADGLDEATLKRRERRAEAGRHALVGQLDRVLELLESRSYVDDWSLTPAGRRLARIYHECDLLVAESLESGALDDLAPPELAAVVSSLAFEHRGRSATPTATKGQGVPARGARRRAAGAGRGRRPSRDDGRAARDPVPRPADALTTERLWRIESLATGLRAAERRLGLPETREPDAGLMSALLAWARGSSLALALELADVGVGDFVRATRQVADLLDQLGEVAPVALTRTSAKAASAALRRGVVEAGG